MKRILLAFVGLAALAGSAAAADLPPRAPQSYYKAPAYIQPYSWTGWYIGVNGGYGWGNSAWDFPATGRFHTDGGVVGGTLGYNYQFGQFVAGLEGDIDWADIYGSGGTVAACGAGCRTGDNWLGTFRGRVGVAADRFLPYLTGGLAFGDIRANLPGVASADTTNAGWTIGGGVEASLVGNWTAKVEYLYVDLGRMNCGTSCGALAGVTDNVSFRTNLLRGGLNYRF